MIKLRLNALCHLSAASAKQRRFEIQAYNGGKLPVDGFPYPVVVDLQGLSIPSSLPILIDHRSEASTTLGLATDIQADGRSVSLKGTITGNSPMVQSVLAMHDNGHRWQASIGCMVQEREEIPAGRQVVVNGQSFTGPIIVARRSTLRETSILPMGADASTSVNLAASAALSMKAGIMSFEEWLGSLGIDSATISEEATAILMRAFEESQSEETATTPTEAAAVLTLRAKAAAESRRIGAIQAKAAGHPRICATAIEKGWSIEKTELEVIKASAAARSGSAAGPIRYGTRGPTDEKTVLRASMLLHMGREKLAETSYGEHAVQAARQNRPKHVMDIVEAAARLNGIDVHTLGRDGLLRAAFSTTSLPNILGDSVGRILEQAYQESPATWKAFCAIKSVPDFREVTAIRPRALQNFDQLGTAGEVKHAVLGEEAIYTYSVATYAKMIRLTRRDVVNDDLSAFSSMAEGFGRAGARSLADFIYGILLSNPGSFFSTGNGNYLQDAAANLQTSSLTTAITAMRTQRDSLGNDLDIMPKTLLVPPSLETTARQLLASELIQRESDDSGPTGNSLRASVDLIVEPRLENTDKFATASAKHWYLFASPVDLPAIAAFLDGQQSPIVVPFGLDSEADTLGYAWRAHFDYGFKLTDPKAAFYSLGEAEQG